MGLLDQLGGSLKNVVGSLAAAEGPAVLSALLAKTNLGSLQGLVDQLQQAGLGEQVKSWLSDGSNMKVTPEQIRAALSSDQVKQIAQHFGVPADEALKMLADHLPGIVDQASPNGKIQRM